MEKFFVLICYGFAVSGGVGIAALLAIGDPWNAAIFMFGTGVIAIFVRWVWSGKLAP